MNFSFSTSVLRKSLPPSIKVFCLFTLFVLLLVISEAFSFITTSETEKKQFTSDEFNYSKSIIIIQCSSDNDYSADFFKDRLCNFINSNHTTTFKEIFISNLKINHELLSDINRELCEHSQITSFAISGDFYYEAFKGFRFNANLKRIRLFSHFSYNELIDIFNSLPSSIETLYIYLLQEISDFTQNDDLRILTTRNLRLSFRSDFPISTLKDHVKNLFEEYGNVLIN